MAKRAQWESCRRHKPFSTEGKAFAHLIEKLRAGDIDPGATTFRCRACRKWHIGGAGRKSLERVMRGE